MSTNDTGSNNLKDYPITTVGINNVKMTDDFWLPKIKTIQKSSVSFGLDKCRKEGRLENFLIAGGKLQGKTRGVMPFDDTDVYKIIEGASFSLLVIPDAGLEASLDGIIDTIATGQEPDGYLTTWFTIDPLDPPGGWVKKTGKRWASEEASHELYNSGHLFEAAYTHFIATGKTNLLDIAIKNADLLVKNFGPSRNTMPPGHQIVETGLIKMYLITKNINYAKLAKYFLDLRGNPDTHDLYGEYSQDHVPVIRQTEAVGHAVRAVYMYAGMTDIAAVFNDTEYFNAVKMIWDNITRKKMYITGGIGSRHEKESFGDDYELPNLTSYCETCAAIGNVSWNTRLFMLTGESVYFDVIERTLYNGLVSGISLDGMNFFYVNPLESDGKFDFNKGSSTRSPWFDCACCPTNLIRFIPSIPGLIYAINDNDLYVNLFASCKSDIIIGGNTINITQSTEYPWNGNVRISIQVQKETEFTLRLRIPGWTKDQVIPGDLYSYIDKSAKQTIIKINGSNVETLFDNGYALIKRVWRSNDEVELYLPMKIRRVIASGKITGLKNLTALEYGPIVYCIEEIDNPHIDTVVLPDETTLEMEKRNDLLGGINVIKGKITTGQTPVDFLAVPYYIWSNRGKGKMKVWIERK